MSKLLFIHKLKRLTTGIYQKLKNLEFSANSRKMYCFYFKNGFSFIAVRRQCISKTLSENRELNSKNRYVRLFMLAFNHRFNSQAKMCKKSKFWSRCFLPSLVLCFFPLDSSWAVRRYRRFLETIVAHFLHTRAHTLTTDLALTWKLHLEFIQSGTP